MEDSEDLSDPDYKITDGEDANLAWDTGSIKPTKTELDHAASGNTDRILDPQGEPLFEPDDLCQPVVSSDHIAKYIASRVHKPFEKANQNKLSAECPRRTVPDDACKTLSVNPKIIQFQSKTGWKPIKGLHFSLQNCQGILGPAEKIFEAVEDDLELDYTTLSSWIQRVIC
ncbi:Hypothetical predicted protein [Pelobates cultripes]|uniref:Uncharacterized protein n=1 Tax=Pelobates cultripes TaxID=61616 RepID=A0AAD1R4H1_PELCU|nr:Hypothetical predicted protein [Pelobates cultripes]